jgi:hypothetical protein
VEEMRTLFRERIRPDMGDEPKAAIHWLQDFREGKFFPDPNSKMADSEAAEEAERLNRYALELEILIWAAEIVISSELNEGTLNRVALLMKAYQLLPYSSMEAARALDTATRPRPVPASPESAHVAGAP